MQFNSKYWQIPLNAHPCTIHKEWFCSMVLLLNNPFFSVSWKHKIKLLKYTIDSWVVSGDVRVMQTNVIRFETIFVCLLMKNIEINRWFPRHLANNVDKKKIFNFIVDINAKSCEQRMKKYWVHRRNKSKKSRISCLYVFLYTISCVCWIFLPMFVSVVWLAQPS